MCAASIDMSGAAGQLAPEDVLQIALRMAAEIPEETVVDFEEALDSLAAGGELSTAVIKLAVVCNGFICCLYHIFFGGSVDWLCVFQRRGREFAPNGSGSHSTSHRKQLFCSFWPWLNDFLGYSTPFSSTRKTAGTELKLVNHGWGRL